MAAQDQDLRTNSVHYEAYRQSTYISDLQNVQEKRGDSEPYSDGVFCFSTVYINVFTVS